MNAPDFRTLSLLWAGACTCLSIGCSTQSRRADGPEESLVRECATADTLTGFTFSVSGFAPGEVDSVRIAEYREQIRVDSFTVAVESNPAASEPHRVYATVRKTMDLKHRYRLYLPGQPSHELTGMKRIPWSRYVGSPEGWSCVMGEFTLDGMRHERNANVDIEKQ